VRVLSKLALYSPYVSVRPASQLSPVMGLHRLVSRAILFALASRIPKFLRSLDCVRLSIKLRDSFHISAKVIALFFTCFVINFFYELNSGTSRTEDLQ
jgi:hypothetical protein